MANGLTKIDNNQVIPFDADLPEHLRNEKTAGITGLDPSDFKLPRIKLLQALSPEIRQFPGIALPGIFWHTGSNISLGNDFKFIPACAFKRVILWSSRNQNATVLAYSKDGRSWDSGGNSQFQIQVKGSNNPVTIRTGANVASSRLLDWGSSDPANPRSPPAATLIYEYLCYLPMRPELSPVMLGLYRTAANNAVKLNTTLLQLRMPTYSVVVDCVSKELQDDGNVWSVPTFKPAGRAGKEAFAISKQIASEYESYSKNYDISDLEKSVDKNDYSKSVNVKDDEIPF